MQHLHRRRSFWTHSTDCGPGLQRISPAVLSTNRGKSPAVCPDQSAGLGHPGTPEGEDHLRRVPLDLFRTVLAAQAGGAGKNSQLTVSTYALMWSNGNYYLVCRHRSMMNLRTDLSLHVELLPETFEPLKDFDPAQYQDRTPGMYPGKETYVCMRCHERILNTLVDFFGSVPQYTQPNSQGLTEITMSIAAEGVKLFALQYADNVELLEPQWLREKSEIP